MKYEVGQKILLAQTSVNMGSSKITVTQTVMVTITDIKTGAPGLYSKKASALPSLLAQDENCQRYGKNWTHWPEGTFSDPEVVWVRLGENNKEEESRLHELCRLYNREVACRMGQRDRHYLEGPRGRPFLIEAVDLGDAKFCQRHDYIICPGDDACPECNVLSRKHRVPMRLVGLQK